MRWHRRATSSLARFRNRAGIPFPDEGRGYQLVDDPCVLAATQHHVFDPLLTIGVHARSLTTMFVLQIGHSSPADDARA